MSFSQTRSKIPTIVIYEVRDSDTEQGTLHARVKSVYALAVQDLLGRSQGASISLFLLNLRSR